MDDGVLVIRPRTEAAEQERVTMEMQQQSQAIGPLRLRALSISTLGGGAVTGGRFGRRKVGVTLESLWFGF